MQRIDFYVFSELGKQIDKMVNKYGFRSRAEFLRYTAIEFIRHDEKEVPTEKTLKESTKLIQNIQTKKRRRFI